MSTEHLLPPTRRKVAGLTIPATTFFVVGEVAGTGVLALPKAVENTGWIGILIIIYLSIISAYTGTVLGNAWSIATRLYEDCRGHVSNPYPLLAEKVYGKPGRYVVLSSTTFALFGTSTVFILLAADNIENLVNGLGADISFCYWLLILMAFLIPMTWLGTPKDFWFVGIGATLGTVIACVCLAILLVMNYNDDLVYHSEIKLDRFAFSMGTVMFGLAGHPIFLSLQMDMKRQYDFKWAVISGFTIICCLYVPVAALGYFLYGEKLTANVLDMVAAGPLFYAVQVFITLHLILAYIITINPLCQAFEDKLGIPKEFSWKRCIARSLLSGIVLFVAETVPRFDAILSLIGGSVYILLDFVCPVMFYMKLCYLQRQFSEKERNEDSFEIDENNFDGNLPLWMKVLNYEVVVIGIVVGLFASVSAIIAIVNPDAFSMPCYVDISAAST